MILYTAYTNWDMQACEALYIRFQNTIIIIITFNIKITIFPNALVSTGNKNVKIETHTHTQTSLKGHNDFRLYTHLLLAVYSPNGA